MRKGMSNMRFSSRFIAFFVTLAMVLSLCTPFVFAADASDGNLYFRNESGEKVTDIDTGAVFDIVATVTYNMDATSTGSVQLHLGTTDLNKIVIEETAVDGDAVKTEGDYFERIIGGEHFTYTLCRDDATDEYYFDIKGANAGSTVQHAVTLKFANGVAIEGDVLKVAIKDDGELLIPKTDSDKTEAEIKANADLEWANVKTVNPSSYTVNDDDTTLGTDLTYTITEAAANSINNDGSVTTSATLANGEAVLQKYTVTDTFTLPEGMYIELGSYSSAAEAVKAMLTLENVPGDYVIDATAVDDKITGFTMVWTETNPNATATAYSTKAMSPKTYTIKLNGNYIKINSETYTTNTIRNTVKTQYAIAEAADNENGYILNDNYYTTERAADTAVPVDGSGMGAVSKKLTGVSGAKANLWGDWFAGYVVAGDKLTYTIYVQNNSEDTNTYTVTDFLSETNLTLESCTYNGTTLPTTTYANGDIGFEVEIGPNTIAAIEVVTTVNEDEEGTISNKASVTLNNETTDPFETDPIPQKNTAPEIYIQKSSDITFFTDDSTFNYSIIVSNNGTAVAENIKITDILPTGVVLNGAVASSSRTAKVADNTISDTVTLGINESITITVPVKIDAEAAKGLDLITNEVTESFSNKVAAATITRHSADVSKLSVVKQADKTIVSEGDKVTYTITVTNPNGGDLTNETIIVKDFLPNGFTYLSDTASSLKDAPTWNSAYMGEGGTVTTTDTDTTPTFTFTNVTIKNGGSFSFTVACQVGEVTSGETITNTVRIFDKNGNEGNSGSADVKAVGTAENATILIDKQIFDANGNEITDGAVAAGETIEFRVTVTNNSTTANLTNFTITDTLVGNYELTNNWAPASQVKVYSITDGSTLGPLNNGFVFNGDRLFINGSVTMNFRSDNGYGCYAYDAGHQYDPSICILPQGCAVLSYTVTTTASFTEGSNSVLATNLADNTTSSDSVSYSASAVEPDPDVPQISNAQLSITKTVENAVLTTNDLEKRNKYTVTITNNSDTAYVSSGATFTDYIPGNTALSIKNNAEEVGNTSYEYRLGEQDINRVDIIPVKITDGAQKEYITRDLKDQHFSNDNNKIPVEITMKNGTSAVDISTFAWKTLSNNNPTLNMTNSEGKYDGANVKDANFKIYGSALTVDFGAITLPAGESIKIEYYLLPTDEEVEAINAEIAKGEFADREYKNEASFEGTTAFINEDGATVNKIIDVETVTVSIPKINPGISKEFSGHFGTSESTEISGADTKVDVGEFYVWTVRVYNGSDAGLTMSDYTVTEKYPEGHSYSGNVGPYTKSIARYNADGSVDNTFSGSYVDPTGADKNVFTFGNDYALKAGQYLEFTICTNGTQTKARGLYTNSVVLTVEDQTIYGDSVIAGTADGDSVSASVTLPLYSLSTTSKKTVIGEDGVTVSSDADALNNRIQASMGDTVTYKLEVTNHDFEYILEDFAIIDRLPYAGDMGVISTEGARGSVFPIKFAGNEFVTATVHLTDGDSVVLDKKYIDIQYGSDAFTSFKSTDLDWISTSTEMLEGTRVAWSGKTSDSTNLVKFKLVNLDQLGNDAFVQENPITNSYIDENGNPQTSIEIIKKYGVPAGATISIEYKANIPSYVQNTGKNNVAWNSFGYYFNSGIEENLIAEPAKVGVWVEDENYGGSILVRKIYKTNLPSKVRDFYFALYKEQYNPDTNNKPLQVVKLSMAGSVDGAQATAYFTNIDFDRSKNNAYYIYESDAAGKPLEAVADGLTWDTYTATKPESGSRTTDVQYTKNIVTAKTAIGVDGSPFTMDNTSQIKSAQDKPNWDQYDGEADHYNTNYLVWHKDLSASKTTNSAIFTNSYFATVDHEMMGPFYADVPTTRDDAEGYMTSTRPDRFVEGTISATEASTERETGDYGNYGQDSAYGPTSQYGGNQGHTIATGFLAKITGIGDYTIEQAKWKITTSVPDNNATGVYVRLRTEEDQNSRMRLMYLDEFEVYEEESEGTLELGAVGGFEDISDDENFLSDYTVEERTAMMAEAIGVDPANVLYDENGAPYVVLDEELESEAFALSEVPETNENNLVVGGNTLEEANFKDKYTTGGYVIYKIKGPYQYTMEFNDNIPHITMSEGAEAYIGLVIDQLYDQKATATIEFSDKPLFDDDMLIATSKADMAEYTLVKSPRQKGNFSINLLYKLTAGAPVGFDDLLVDGATAKYDTTIQNAAGTARIAATSAKTVSVNATSHQYYKWGENGVVKQTGSEKYSSYLALGGTGTKDYRSLIVNVPAGSTLRVIARSSGSDERTLKVEEGNENITELIVPGSNADESTASERLSAQQVYVEEGGAVYLYSKNSGINIFSIEIVSGDQTSN